VSAAEKSPEARDARIGLDDAVDIDSLLGRDELGELTARFAEAHGCAVAVEDRRGRILAAQGSIETGSAMRYQIRHGGEVLGHVIATGPGAERTAHLLADVLGLLLHHAHARALTRATHEAAMEQSFADLTQQNARLEQALQRLTEVDRLKSSFLATMSHELRTPLTSVIGYSEMLLEGLAGALAAEQRDYITTILSKADQLLQMITSVLDVSMLEAQRVEVDEAQVALAEMVDSVVASFVPQAQKRGIAITVDTSAALIALGDRRKIRQVVWNLLSNAVKFSRDQGQVAVVLREGALRPGEPTAPRGALVEITDSGIGISRHQLALIFEPFFQVDQSSTREYGGSGLGLTLAKAYVEAHGGRIWVDSTLGTGSTFTVSFPIAAAAPPAEPG
jgi:two-component system sensor histidine kinase BarA